MPSSLLLRNIYVRCYLPVSALCRLRFLCIHVNDPISFLSRAKRYAYIPGTPAKNSEDVYTARPALTPHGSISRHLQLIMSGIRRSLQVIGPVLPRPRLYGQAHEPVPESGSFQTEELPSAATLAELRRRNLARQTHNTPGSLE